MIFTTPMEYQAWSGDATPPAQPTVDQANDAMTSTLRGALYDADAEGRPTTALEEIKRATNVQVQALLKAEQDSASASSEGVLTGATIAGVSYTYAANPAVLGTLLLIPEDGGLCVWSRQILASAPGIYWNTIWVEG